MELRRCGGAAGARVAGRAHCPGRVPPRRGCRKGKHGLPAVPHQASPRASRPRYRLPAGCHVTPRRKGKQTTRRQPTRRAVLPMATAGRRRVTETGTETGATDATRRGAGGVLWGAQGAARGPRGPRGPRGNRLGSFRPPKKEPTATIAMTGRAARSRYLAGGLVTLAARQGSAN